MDHFELRHHFIMDQFMVIVLRHHFIMDHFELQDHLFEFRHHLGDMFLDLNRFEFHLFGLHIIKTSKFCFSCITDVSLVLPNSQDDNLKHSHNTEYKIHPHPL